MPDWLFCYGVAANAAGFLLCALDKGRARRRQRRVPEKRLWQVCFLGGCFGMYLGMALFCHKVRYRRFAWGVPFVCAVYTGVFLYFFSSFWK